MEGWCSGFWCKQKRGEGIREGKGRAGEEREKERVEKACGSREPGVCRSIHVSQSAGHVHSLMQLAERRAQTEGQSHATQDGQVLGTFTNRFGGLVMHGKSSPPTSASVVDRIELLNGRHPFLKKICFALV